MSSNIALKEEIQKEGEGNNQQQLQRKINQVTEDLTSSISRNRLVKMYPGNALTVCNYLIAMRTETTLSSSYKSGIIQALCYLERFYLKHPKYLQQKLFQDMDRDYIVMYLNSIRRPELEDSQHASIGTYNLHRTQLLRFFKWLYSPSIPANARPTPAVIQNIPKLRRKEMSTIKPSDLWTEEDDALFLKYYIELGLTPPPKPNKKLPVSLTNKHKLCLMLSLSIQFCFWHSFNAS